MRECHGYFTLGNLAVLVREGALLSVEASRAERIVVACALDARQCARLREALRHQAAIREAESFDALCELLRSTAEHVDCVVVAGRGQNGAEAANVVRHVVRQWPRTAVVAYCRAGLQQSSDLRALAIAGVHQFVFDGIDDVGVAFRSLIDSGRQTCAAEWLMGQLGPELPPAVHPMLDAALSKASEITNVTELASKLGVTRTTLFNRCVRAESLLPEELLVWARLAVAAFFLETTGCTVEAIAYQLSFPSDNTLRNTMKRYTGLTASQLRASGGVARLVAALRRRVAAHEAKISM